MITNFFNNPSSGCSSPIPNSEKKQENSKPNDRIPLAIKSVSAAFKKQQYDAPMPISTFTTTDDQDRIAWWRKLGVIKPLNVSSNTKDNIFSEEKITYTIPKKYVENYKKFLENPSSVPYPKRYDIDLPTFIFDADKSFELSLKGRQKLEELKNAEKKYCIEIFLRKGVLRTSSQTNSWEIDPSYLLRLNARLKDLKTNKDKLSQYKLVEHLSYFMTDLKYVLRVFDCYDLAKQSEFAKFTPLLDEASHGYFVLTGRSQNSLPPPPKMPADLQRKLDVYIDRGILLDKYPLIFFTQPEKILNPKYVQNLKVTIHNTKAFHLKDNGLFVYDQYKFSLLGMLDDLNKMTQYSIVDQSDVQKLKELDGLSLNKIAVPFIDTGVLVERESQSTSSESQKSEDMVKQPKYVINMTCFESLQKEFYLNLDNKLIDLEKRHVKAKKLLQTLHLDIFKLRFLGYHVFPEYKRLIQDFEQMKKDLLGLTSPTIEQLPSTDINYLLPAEPMEHGNSKPESEIE